MTTFPTINFKWNVFDSLKWHSIARKYAIKYGILFSLILPIMLLPSHLLVPEEEKIRTILGSMAVLFLMCITGWICIQFILKFFHASHISIKILLGMLACTAISALFSALFSFNDFPDLNMQDLTLIQKTGFILHRGFLMGFALLMPALLLEKLKNEIRIKKEMEVQLQNHLSTKLHSLHRQLDLHFLFNSLNILRAGAREEWVRAFVIQIAHFYRYALTHNEGSGLVRINEEWQFTMAYINILRERFEMGLIVTSVLSAKTRTRTIPILALQTLVENAVKHNVISAACPLRIHVYEENDFLVVTNNFQPKRPGLKNKENRSGTGLSNLNKRYNLFIQTSIRIELEKNSFTVKIPMI